MGFSAKQLQALRRNVEERYIRTRESNGKELTYIEGWYAVAQANRIFGFDGWSRETVDSKCVLARENRGAFLAVYTAKVRVTVYSGSSPPIIREGHGTGEGRAGTPGEVHDTALKAAETDATKRALATFGRPFGLELYRGQRRDAANRSDKPQAQARSSAQGVSQQQSSSPPEPLPHTQAQPHPEARPKPQSPLSPSIVPATEPLAMQPGNNAAAGTQNEVPRPPSERLRDPDSVGSERSDSQAVKAIPVPNADSQLPSPSDTQQPDRGETPPLEEPALPLAPALPPDDTSPIPRPSRYYGRREYLATRERTGALMHELARRAEASLAEAPEKIDKSVLTFGEPKRLRDKAHLRFVGSQPCLICGRQPADAHHLRFAQPRALGRKVSDEYTVPLCRGHHRQVHQTGNEPAFWEDLDINALEIAKGLWEQSRGISKGG